MSCRRGHFKVATRDGVAKSRELHGCILSEHVEQLAHELLVVHRSLAEIVKVNWVHQALRAEILRPDLTSAQIDTN